MIDYLITISAALIGSLGSIFLRDYLQRRTEEEKARIHAQKSLVQRYLLQFQDATVSLYYRLYNIAHRLGKEQMTQSYYEVSSLCALARMLAYERILILDGVYPQLEEIYPELGRFIKDQLHKMEEQLAKLDEGLMENNELKERRFYRYNRLALAEAVMERVTNHLQTITYMDFRRQYESPDSLVRTSLEPARHFIGSLPRKDVDKLLKVISQTVKRLENVTGIPTTIS
jgi:hypothetical protein